MEASKSSGTVSLRIWRSVWRRRSSAVARWKWRRAWVRARSIEFCASLFHWNFDRGFGFGAAAQAPGGMDYLGGEGRFHGAFGSEVLLEAFAEKVIDVLFFGANDVAGGIDAEEGGVAGHAGFAFDGPGTR